MGAVDKACDVWYLRASAQKQSITHRTRQTFSLCTSDSTFDDSWEGLGGVEMLTISIIWGLFADSNADGGCADDEEDEEDVEQDESMEEEEVDDDDD